MKEQKNPIKERMLKAGRAHAAEQAKKGVDRARDTAENLMDDGQITPEEYASDQVKYTSEEAADYAVHAVGHDAKAAVQKGRESVRRRAEKAKNKGGRGEPPASAVNTTASDRSAASAGSAESGTGTTGAPSDRPRSGRVRQTGEARSVSRSTRFERSGRVHKANSLGTRNMGAEAVKVPGSLSGAKNQQAAALSRKAAIRSAQNARRTETLVRRQGERAAKTAKEAAQAAKRGARAAIEAAKSAMAAMAAGGSASMVFLIPVLVIALLAGSVFAIFLPSENPDDGMNMRTAIHGIEEEYNDRIEEIKADYTYDELEITGSRAPWRDVLAVYAVKVNTDPENPQEVVTMDLSHLMILREVFWDMNEISEYTETVTETEYVESEDEDGNPVTEIVETEWTVLHITVNHWTAMEQAELYGFSEDRIAQLEELLSPQYASLWNDVLYGTHSGSSDLVTVALSQVGNSGETYWTYMGYTGRVEWCACFVSWCANECGYIEDGTLPQTASCSAGVSWFQERNRWQEPTYTDATGQTVPYIPAPGDIIYFDWDREGEGQNGRPDHVGIVEKVENDYVYTVEGNSGDRVSKNAWRVGYYEIFGFGLHSSNSSSLLCNSQ